MFFLFIMYTSPDSVAQENHETEEENGANDGQDTQTLHHFGSITHIRIFIGPRLFQQSYTQQNTTTQASYCEAGRPNICNCGSNTLAVRCTKIVQHD